MRSILKFNDFTWFVSFSLKENPSARKNCYTKLVWILIIDIFILQMLCNNKKKIKKISMLIE